MELKGKGGRLMKRTILKGGERRKGGGLSRCFGRRPH